MFLLGVGSDSVIVYIGCFKDNENGSRVMKEFQQNFPDSMTIQKCIDLCYNNGFRFAGMQYR